MSAARALSRGLIDVLTAPLLVAGTALVLLILTAPFAAVLHSGVQQSLSVQPQVSLAETEIDPEWWMEFRAHARGLAATFTPAVLGFAATLDGINRVMDGEAIPFALVTPLVLSVVAWALLWGGILQRLRHRRGLGARKFFAACIAHLPTFLLIAILAAVINLLLYVTVHRALFGPIHSWLVAMTDTERDAFLIRVLLYVVFFSLVALVSLVADYARIAASGRPLAIADAIREALSFIMHNRRSVIALYLMTGAIFAVVTTTYGVLEIYGGSQVGGWRAVAIGQAYVLVRLAIRLTFAASELRLFNANQTAAVE